VTGILRTISHSERDCFNNCRALWHARYVLGAIPQSSHPVRRLGALFEAAFAARLRGWCVSLGLTPWPAVRRDVLGRSFLDLDTPPDTSPEQAIERACKREQWPFSDKYGSTEEAADLALALVERTYEAMGFAGGRFKPVVIKGWACVQARLTGPLPVPADSYAAQYYPGGASGVLDLFVYDGERNWRPVLVDTKVRESLSSEPDLGCDPQLALYQHLCASNGVRVYQCEQWEILGKLPEEPPLLKSGKGISRDAEYRATRETFLAAARRHNIDLSAPVPLALDMPAPLPAGASKKEEAAHKKALALVEKTRAQHVKAQAQHDDYMEHLDSLDRRRWYQATPGGGTDAEIASLVRDFAADADLMAALAVTTDADWPVAKPITRNLRTFAGSSCMRCDLLTDCHRSHASGQTLAEAVSNRPKNASAPQPIEVDSLEVLA
jgi:hypothetical protein